MEITSSAFENKGLIPSKYTCDGQNVNPPLYFSEIPEGAKSLALIVDDPDAPAKTWVHWLIWNISPSTKIIGENNFPKEALAGTNDSGQTRYNGPCPATGVHRYFFKLYALSDKLTLPAGADKQTLLSQVKRHQIGYAELMGRYSKEQ